MIPLTKYDFQWARSELVIIYPELMYPDVIATGSASKLQGDGVLIPGDAANWSLLSDWPEPISFRNILATKVEKHVINTIVLGSGRIP